MLGKLGGWLFKSLGEEQHNFAAEENTFDQIYTKLAEFYKLHEFLPYDAYDPQTKTFHDQETVGFVVETSPLVGASSEMQKEISNLFALALPEGSSLQALLWADPNLDEDLHAYTRARDSVGDTLQEMARNRAEYLKRLSETSILKPYTLRNFRCFISVTKPRSNPRADQEAIDRIKGQLTTTLEMLGLAVKVWGASELIQAVESILGGISSSHIVKTQWNPLQSIKEQCTGSEFHLKVEEDGLTLKDPLGEDLIVRTFGVKSYPSEWSLNAMGELIGDQDRDQAQIPCPFLLHYGVNIPHQDSPKQKLIAKTSYVERQAYSPIGKYLPSIVQEAEELAFIREEINKGERIVRSQFTAILMGKPQEIDQVEQILINLFTSKGWKLEANRYLHLPVFLTSLPMMWGQERVRALLNLKKIKTTLSTESANLLPLQGEWKGTPTPAMILTGRRGQPFSWSPFDNTAGNYNACVVGRSGSGKSVFMQELMTSILGLGGRVFVLDVGRSFEKTCFLLQGQFIEFSPNTPLCLNPFTGIPCRNEEVASDALAMLKSVLALMAAPSLGVDDKGSAILEQAMLEVWNKYKNEATISLVADWLTNNPDNLAKDLGQMLYPYTSQGTYGRFFNGASTVNLNNSLVVIELEELKERKDLQAVIVQMMVITISSQMFMGDRKTPFLIVFDEAWDMLRGKQGGAFIETLARRLRKYFGSLIVGTQSVHDFFQSPGAQAAFDNSDWMCMLSQKAESIAQLKKLDRLSVSSQQEKQLLSLKTRQGKYAEVMISGSMGYAVGRLLLDPYSSLLYSTKAQDYSAVKALLSKGVSVDKAIKQLLEERVEAA
jgi:conjugal transfer ATP-binding protein TraC